MLQGAGSGAHRSWRRSASQQPRHPTSGIPGIHSDISDLRRGASYAAFVAVGVLLTSLMLAAVAAITRAATCPHQGGCVSLERDLASSIDSSVHPCDDFHR